MVRVNCMTFNHSAYINDALDGFCMQETTFPFVCTIVDDASTDGEQKVINSYLREHFDLEDNAVVRMEETDDYYLTYAQHKTNRNCFFVVLLLKYNHYSIKKAKSVYFSEWNDSAKYVAICEGDDYWISKNKLQDQVLFMENNLEYSMCFGDAIYYDSDKKHSKGSINRLFRKDNILLERYEGKDLFYRIVLGKAHIQTLTVLYRKECFDRRIHNNRGFMMGDTPLWLDLSQTGRVKYIDTIMGVYNIHQGSATHNPLIKTRFSLSMYEMRCYYCEKFGYEIPKYIKKKYNNAYLNSIIVNQKGPADPLYGLFRINAIQYYVDSLILRNSFCNKCYSALYPLKRKISVSLIRIGMLIKVVKNSV